MKQRTSLIKRCIALALALVLIVSQANLGIVQHAHAADNDKSTTIAQIVADNYDLSEAEKALLKSDVLASETFTYTVPNDNSLVSVDTDNAKITAESKDGWVPTKAIITYGSETLEVVIENGVGTYDAAKVGNAFSVQVIYVLNTTVAASTQEKLLGAADLLKQALENLDAVTAQGGNLLILETAMPELVNLAENGYQTNFGAGSMQEAFIESTRALNAQMTANGGQLNLSVMIDACKKDTKTGYLMANGVKMQEELVVLAEHVKNLNADLSTVAGSMDFMLGQGWVSEDLASKIKLLAERVASLNEALADLVNVSWPIAELDAVLVDDVDYAKLDTLAAALGETTAVTVKETLKVDETSLQVNLSMWNVTVQVVLNHVVNNALTEGYKAEKVVILADGAASSELDALLAEMENELKVSDVYVSGKFDRAITEIPTTVTEDLTIVVTYNPKSFDVTIAGETNAYPYGWELTLPVHTDAAQSYDYFDANGVKYAQGTVVVVEDNMVFTRETGKSYSAGQLYAIISSNYATEKVAAILASGAVKGDETISYREPSKEELESLVKLNGSTLTVQTYASSYAGLNWAPYSYVVNGNTYFFNGASSVDITEDFETVDVFYRLTMTNYTEAEVRAIFDLVAALVSEAEGQKSVMDRLAGYEADMAQLNPNMLLGLNGMLDGQVGKYGQELVDSMKAAVGDILNKSFDNAGNLKLNLVIAGYTDENNGGLGYYYQNAEYIRGEISFLSEKLEALLGDENAKDLLAELLNSLGYGAYVDKLDDLNVKIAEINADLAPVNANIDTTNAAKLAALAKALTMEGSVAIAECGNPYIEMDPVIRTADKYVTVEVKVNANGNTNTFSVTILKGAALTQAQINELKAKIDAFVNGKINTAFFNNNYSNGAELNALVGAPLDASAAYEYTWSAKEYTVKIEGEKDQIVSINNLTIDLPAHPNAEFGLSYEYTIGSKTANAGIYTFTESELLNLFVNGVLTITRIERNANVETLEQMIADINIGMGFKALELVSENGVYTGIEANISAADMMNLMMNLVMKSKYGYIGLNNEGFIYKNESSSLELSIQTLINAMLNDDTFSHKTIIALGENGKGKLLTSSMQLGASASELQYSDLTFTVNLKSVPQQLVDYVSYIKLATNYITFHSDNGVMAIELNLPDQAYAAYASALVATGHVEKNDINGLKQRVAVEFLKGYLDAITGSEMDLVTYSNTLEMLGIDRSLASYNNYYTSAMAAYNACVEITVNDDNTAIDLSAPGQKTINALLSLLGINSASINQFLPMLKEYKDGVAINFNTTAQLLNVDKTYYALVLDAQASGLTNKVEAPSNEAVLAKELAELAGYSVVILTADVDRDLTISGTTVLDLNGFDVNGTIKATGRLFIIDSSMDTAAAGTVENVTGNATILAGNYLNDVSSKLKNGYYMDGTTVRNALYTITEVDNTITFILNADVYENEHVDGYLPDVTALAVDIASDLLLNYFSTAKLAVGGYELIGVNVDDLVGLYASDDKIADLAKTLLGCFTIGEEGYENNAGFEGVVNMILEDLLDFGAITEALENGTALFNYELTTAPWLIEIDHKEGENYATIDVGYNEALAKTFNVALVIESKVNDNIAAMTGVLAEIVEADKTYAMVDIPQPTYGNKTLTLAGAAKASLVMDMSKDNKYAVAIAVILANGNPAKAEAVAAAVNADDMNALKKVVDNTSVAEIFTALKKLDRTTGFAAMAKKIGITADVADAAALEAKFHLVFCGIGKALEELDITGMSSKLGGLYNKETGYYELTKANIFRDAEISARGYAALVELEATEMILKVKLFGDEPDCLWGDANHDGLVNAMDATLVEQYAVGLAPESFCTIRTDVNADGEINAMDASLIRQYAVEIITVFPAEIQ